MECQSTPMQLTHHREQARSHRYAFHTRFSRPAGLACNWVLFETAHLVLAATLDQQTG